MSPVLRATALLFGSSSLSLVIWFAATKLWTLMLGADGLGLISLFQSLVAFSAMAAGLGAGMGVVRLGAGDELRLAALGQAAWQLYWWVGAPFAALVVIFQAPIAAWAIGDAAWRSGVAWMGPALMLSMAAGLQMGLLSAHEQVAALARMNLAATALGCTVSVGLIAAGGSAAVPAAVIAIYGSTWLVSRVVLWRTVDRKAAPIRPEASAVRLARRRLVAFGLPYTASMLVGAGVLQAMPILVLHGLGATAVGFFRAAGLLADHALGGLVAVMAQGYYPRVAGAERAALGALVNEQHRLVLQLATPAIFTLYGLSPYVIPLVFSAEFAPMRGLLEWLLVGSLLKFAAWNLSYVVLARSRSRAFFLLELVAGAGLLVTSLVGMRFGGLEGLGAAAAVSYAAYYAAAWALAREATGLELRAGNLGSLFAALAALLTLQALPLFALAALKSPLALTAAALFGLWGLRGIRQRAPLPIGD